MTGVPRLSEIQPFTKHSFSMNLKLRNRIAIFTVGVSYTIPQNAIFLKMYKRNLKNRLLGHFKSL